MIKFLWTLLFAVCFGWMDAQEFEDFTLEKEVKIFLEKNFSDLKSFNLGVKVKNEDQQLYLDSIEYSPWFVADFNDDGLLDLFVQGYKRKTNESYLIIAKEDAGVYELVSVSPTKVNGDLNIPFIEETKDGPLIVYKQYASEQTVTMKNGNEVRFPKNFNSYYSLGFLRKDTLIYKFDRLVEYTSVPNLSGLRFIQMHSYCQFGGCADFKLKIDSVGGMILQNIKNTELEEGIFKAQCDPDLFRNLLLRLKYLHIPKNEMKFGEPTEDHVNTLMISFDDGRIVKVMDYNRAGTLGIQCIYDYLEEIRKTTLW